MKKQTIGCQELRCQLLREGLVFNWFLERESTASKDTVKIIERTTKDLDNYINVVD